MKTKNLLLLALWLFTLLYFCMKLAYNLGKEDAPHPEPIHVTDTIYMDKPYKPMVIKDLMIPYIAKFWQVDSTQLSEYKLRLIQDSMKYALIIEGLKDSIRISETYLKTYPRYPKLLGLDLYRDSLSLTTLSINGITKTEKYNLFLQDYNYSWSIDGLGYQKAKYKREKVNRISQHIGIQYDMLNKLILPSYQIRLNLNRIEFSISASQELYFNNKPELRLEVNYKFTK